ncbi:MAG TPA: FmdB family transcriptional regulator [Lacunisphaera sp.]|nr:FmdB family transcriptional regulator [Lacunisphaera sp.]
MPIYEFYSPDTNKIYSYYAKTLAQGRIVPKCPDDPKARMKKLVSGFAVGGRRKEEPASAPGGDLAPGGAGPDEAQMAALEREFSSMDENDPKAMARMMRRMAELSGEKLDEPMEEAVRKLEEGADPEALEDELGDAFGPTGEDDPYGKRPAPPTGPEKDPGVKERKPRLKVRRPPPRRDPRLYEYE